MPKGDSIFIVTAASATMSFPCGYTFIGDKKSKSVVMRLHKKKCPECINNKNATFDSMIEYNFNDVLPSGLNSKDFHKIYNKFPAINNSPKFDILEK